ncbi:MAG: glutamine--tRNA ligase/YqeY domain fusion protein [Desulfovibrio sp.]
MTASAKDGNAPASNFVKSMIEEDNKSGRFEGRVHTRFPPEPNGYLHIGHAKSICLNFGIAKEFGGKCNLRFDDTNPVKESTEYVEAIQKDVKWLGFDWEDRLFYASDYFDKLYEFAEELIKEGLAYVDSQSAEQIRETRGTLKEPGTPSPYRDRSVEENLELFRGMKAGEYEEGELILRAKIDMASPNFLMRDPALYRIRKVHHHRTGDKWCIYPMYDFTHCISDAIENITHSLCTLEFANNRELYDWVLGHISSPSSPYQTEFARLNLAYTVTSKRKLNQLVEDNIVEGWDDPRMPTLSGMRRRGYPAAAIRNFCERIGVARADSLVDFSLLEFCVREKLNDTAPRLMGVVNPLKVVITNYPEDQVDEFEFPYHPEDDMGSRMVPFTRELYIEREDFREEAPRKFFRMKPGQEVRLRYAYYVTCTDFVKDENGEVVEVHCTYDPESRGGGTEDGRRVRGTMHWVSATKGLKAEVRMYDHLFHEPNPADPKHDKEFTEFVNPNSLEIRKECYVEPSLADAEPGMSLQFERIGYFCVDTVHSKKGQPVFNRTATLRDSWAKLEKKLKG